MFLVFPPRKDIRIPSKYEERLECNPILPIFMPILSRNAGTRGQSDNYVLALWSHQDNAANNHLPQVNLNELKEGRNFDMKYELKVTHGARDKWCQWLI